jgi:hypothetical protein
LLLVAHMDVPADAVREMLKTIYEGHFALLTQPQSLSDASPELPLHGGAVAYRDRDKPLVPKELLDVLAKLITLWVFASATCFALSRYFLRDPTRCFVYYLREFTHLDLVARGITEDPAAPRLPLQRVAYLEDRLSRLKAQMIQEIADTKLYREGTMGTVMSLISDTRASLNAQRAKLEGREDWGGYPAAAVPQEQAPRNHTDRDHCPVLRRLRRPDQEVEAKSPGPDVVRPQPPEEGESP